MSHARTLVAGIDTSTQSTKVRISDAQTGEMVRFGQAKHPEGTSVHPDAWWQAFLQAAQQAGGLNDVAALSVGGQQHGMILLDKYGNVLTDALLWNDTRSAPQADWLIRVLGDDDQQNDNATGRNTYAHSSAQRCKQSSENPGEQHSEQRSEQCGKLQVAEPCKQISGRISEHRSNQDGNNSEPTFMLSDDPQLRGKQRWVQAVGSSPVASLTITKVAWVAQHEPQIANQIAAICLPHDWLSWRIAGHGPLDANSSEKEQLQNLQALFTDRSDASGTGYFDSVANQYRYDLLALALGVSLDAAHQIILPRVLSCHEIGGYADVRIAGADHSSDTSQRNIDDPKQLCNTAEQTGSSTSRKSDDVQADGAAHLSRCVIGPGGGDNAMAVLGLGMSVGDISISLGTSGVAAAISERPVYDMSASITGFADCTGHWLPLACTINGSRIIDAVCHALDASYDEIALLASKAAPGAQGVTLIPYFDGERTPNRPDATATFYGLTLNNCTRENIARAFVEALLCSQRDCLELVQSLGVQLNRILLIGGGAKSKAIRALAANILGADVELPHSDEYVAIGAAKQAAWVLTQNENPPSWPLEIEATLQASPQTEHNAAHNAAYEQYCQYRG